MPARDRSAAGPRPYPLSRGRHGPPATLGSAADAGCIITAASIIAGIVTFGMMHSLFTAPAECKQILETFVAVQQALADGAVPALGGSLGPAEEHPAEPAG